MTLFGKHLEVAPWSAAKIEYRERRLTFDLLQQHLNVLADVVIARAFPEFFGTLIVVLEREAGDFLQVLRMQFHTRAHGLQVENRDGRRHARSGAARLTLSPSLARSVQ